MTDKEREEAIAVLKAIIPKDSRGNGKVLNTLAITKAILMGIEALEQQPRFLIHEDGKMEQINPQQKTGHWITQWNATHQKEYYYCSECREEFSYDGETGIKMNDYSYCPHCGARMEAKE